MDDIIQGSIDTSNKQDVLTALQDSAKLTQALTENNIVLTECSVDDVVNSDMETLNQVADVYTNYRAAEDAAIADQEKLIADADKYIAKLEAEKRAGPNVPVYNQVEQFLSWYNAYYAAANAEEVPEGGITVDVGNEGLTPMQKLKNFFVDKIFSLKKGIKIAALLLGIGAIIVVVLKAYFTNCTTIGKVFNVVKKGKNTLKSVGVSA